MFLKFYAYFCPTKRNKHDFTTMNYEELLETRDARKTSKVRLPYGYFYKRLIDGKYSNFVEFHDEVADNITFSNCVRQECEALSQLNLKQQLHFTPNEGNDGIYAIAVEVGNYVTIEQLLNENPAMVAQSSFINETLRGLFAITSELNEHNIFHVCFSPSNILVRKNDATIRLLCHGSFYHTIDADVLYEGVEDYVAPEVFNDGTIDSGSDVYSLGKFISWLYQSSGLPIELKRVVEKATNEDPDSRYPSIEALQSAINTSRNVKRTALMTGSAAAIALVILGLFFYMLPNTEPIEYVRPVEEPVPDDLLEEDMDVLLGIGADADSATIAQVVMEEEARKDSLGEGGKRMREYNAKAEAIFRKQFSKAADAILSKVYNPEMMNGTEQNFAAKNRQMTEELAKKQEELTQLTSLSPDRTQAIASQIIEQITRKKMEAMDKDYMNIRGSKESYSKSSTPALSGTDHKK